MTDRAEGLKNDIIETVEVYTDQFDTTREEYRALLWEYVWYAAIAIFVLVALIVAVVFLSIIVYQRNRHIDLVFGFKIVRPEDSEFDQLKKTPEKQM